MRGFMQGGLLREPEAMVPEHRSRHSLDSVALRTAASRNTAWISSTRESRSRELLSTSSPDGVC